MAAARCLGRSELTVRQRAPKRRGGWFLALYRSLTASTSLRTLGTWSRGCSGSTPRFWTRANSGAIFRGLRTYVWTARPQKERTREQTRELFESIHALSKKGMKNAQVARSLRIHRHTVEKYLAFKTPPERGHFTKKVSAIAPYEDYILGRWDQGCRNATRIWREISEQGYPGAYQNVGRITRYLKEQERLAKPIPERPPGISASHAAGILVKRSAIENRSEEEMRTLGRG